MIGYVFTPAGDGQAGVEAEQGLVALGGSAPPDDARCREKFIDGEGDRCEGPGVGGIVKRPVRELQLLGGRQGDRGRREEILAVRLRHDVPRDIPHVRLRERRSAASAVLLK
jgi:hypothetical protein